MERRVQMLRQGLEAKYAEIVEANDYIPILYHTAIIIMMISYIFNMNFCYDIVIMIYRKVRLFAE